MILQLVQTAVKGSLRYCSGRCLPAAREDDAFGSAEVVPGKNSVIFLQFPMNIQDFAFLSCFYSVMTFRLYP